MSAPEIRLSHITRGADVDAIRTILNSSSTIDNAVLTISRYFMAQLVEIAPDYVNNLIDESLATAFSDVERPSGV